MVGRSSPGAHLDPIEGALIWIARSVVRRGRALEHGRDAVVHDDHRVRSGEADAVSVGAGSIDDPAARVGEADLQPAVRARVAGRGTARASTRTSLDATDWRVNHKRVYRLYTAEGLGMRRRRPRRRRTAAARRERPAVQRADDTWAMDFVSDELFDGRRFRLLTIVDLFTRESLAIPAAQHFGGDLVAATLEGLRVLGRKPRSIRVDNGPEFTSKALDHWAFEHKVELDFSRPGKPTDNAFSESFNARLRQECLNTNWFASLAEARSVLDAWRRDYNEERPHSSLGNLAPSEFAATDRAMARSVAKAPELSP